MNALLNREIIELISDDMAVNPSYIEKDYYAVKILAKLADFVCLEHPIIFSGGTSLSKGFGLIKRFSEDLDFEIDASETISKGQRKQIRHSFIDKLKEIEDIQIVDDYAENEGKKHTVLLSYPHLFPIPDNLRDNLKVEIFFEPSKITTLPRTINSFISQYTNQNQENVNILCNHPFSIMADKFNALTWRVFDGGNDFDYTIMRHLHDLCAINKHYDNPDDFKTRVIENFIRKDQARVPNMKFEDLLKTTNQKLVSDDKYRKSYERFVNSMSYAPDNELITFDIALQCYQNLSKLFL